ncbi:MAG: hypothetical protein ACLKAN_13535 [Alkaliphilus sp.]
MVETIKYLEGRKLAESKREGEYEYNQIHIIRIENDKMYKEIINICEEYDDYEEAYNKGINYCWEDLYSIDVKKFLETTEEYIKNKIEDYGYVEEDNMIIDTRELYHFLEKYDGYSLIFKEQDAQLVKDTQDMEKEQ